MDDIFIIILVVSGLLVAAAFLLWLHFYQRRKLANEEKKRTDAEVHRVEERYRTIVENSDEGIILQEASGKIVLWNKAAERIFGIPGKDALGHTSISRDWNTVHEDGSPFPGSEHPSMKTLATGKHCKDVIMGIRSTTGELSWVSISTSPLFNIGEDKPYAVVITFSDITNRKIAEDAVKEKGVNRTIVASCYNQC